MTHQSELGMLDERDETIVTVPSPLYDDAFIAVDDLCFDERGTFHNARTRNPRKAEDRDRERHEWREHRERDEEFLAWVRRHPIGFVAL